MENKKWSKKSIVLLVTLGIVFVILPYLIVASPFIVFNLIAIGRQEESKRGDIQLRFSTIDQESVAFYNKAYYKHYTDTTRESFSGFCNSVDFPKLINWTPTPAGSYVCNDDKDNWAVSFPNPYGHGYSCVDSHFLRIERDAPRSLNAQEASCELLKSAP